LKCGPGTKLDGHRSLMTLEWLFSEYNEDFI